MIEINLLPQKEKDRIIAQRTSKLFTALIIPFSILILLLVGLLLFFIFNFTFRVKSIDNQISDLKNQKTKFTDTKQKIDEFNNILVLVKQLSQYKTDWPKILSDLATKTPIDLQITEFSYGTKSGETKTKNQAKISGIAKTYRDVILLQEKLKDSGEFKNPIFVSATTNDNGTVAFKLSVELKNIKAPVETPQKSSSSEGEK